MSRTFQANHIDLDLSTFDNLLSGAYQLIRGGLFAATFRGKKNYSDEQRARVAARAVARLLGLEPVIDVMARNLDFAAQRRIEIGRSLMSGPRLLLLDEPTAGVDAHEAAELVALVKRMQVDLGLAVLLIEHYVQAVMENCNPIYVLDQGTLIAAARRAKWPQIPRCGRRTSARVGQGRRMLELRNVSTGYGRLPVLFGINLRVDSGEMVGVLGPNGAGKSTLMKTILGLLPCRKGGIAFRGKKISHQPAHVRFASGISLCPEGRRVFKNLSVRENLLAGAFGQDKTVVGEQLQAVFSIFPRLDERKDQRAGSLSGGEQQMLAISRALMSRPRLLLVDELSMGLAPLVVEELLDTLRQLCDRGLSVIVVDQFASRLVGRADRGEVLEKGRIVFSGAVDAAERHMDETYLSDEMVAAAAKGV